MMKALVISVALVLSSACLEANSGKVAADIATEAETATDAPAPTCEDPPSSRSACEDAGMTWVDDSAHELCQTPCARHSDCTDPCRPHCTITGRWDGGDYACNECTLSCQASERLSCRYGDGNCYLQPE